MLGGEARPGTRPREVELMHQRASSALRSLFCIKVRCQAILFYHGGGHICGCAVPSCIRGGPTRRELRARRECCCWICGNRDHWSDQCPDNCCWSCGDRDHWSYRCPRTGVRSVEVNIAGMKIYDSLVEAMIDNKFKDLRGARLMSAYLVDIAAVEQRVHHVTGKGGSILQERLRLLRRKAEELAAVMGCSTVTEAAEPETASC